MRIWIDLENSPHVPFFVPIIRDLRAQGHTVIITARDFAQTKGLVAQAGLDVTFIGKEAGDRTLKKTIALLGRALKLGSFIRSNHVDVAVAHGSRGLLLATKLLNIPSLILYDYEGANVRLFNRLATRVMTPEVIPFSRLESLGLVHDKHLTYHGLKEEVYVSEFTLNPLFTESLSVDSSKIIITVRPPSHTAHYRSAESFALFDALMLLLSKREDVQMIFTPRSEKQSREIRLSPWFIESMMVLDIPVNGLDLLAISDLVVGGGGTMNREAAVLGVPVISIFKGEEGAVDHWLESQGLLKTISAADEVLPFIHGKKLAVRTTPYRSTTKEEIVQAIFELSPKHQVRTG